MGMDFIELIMGVEEAFDIAIPGRDTECLETVRELALYVAQCVPRRCGSECRTQRAFHSVRRVLARLHLPRPTVAPQADLYALKPVLAHPEVWPLVGKSLGIGGSEWPVLPKSYAWRKLTPATSLPYGLRTPGELARHVATCQLRKTEGPWTAEEVLLRVRQLVTHQREIFSFPDNAHFFNDLGFD